MTTPRPSIFGEPGEVPGDSRADAPGSLFAWADDHPQREGDAPGDPADRFPSRASRAAAFAAWKAEGMPWPCPAGLASSCLRALIAGREDRDA